MNKVTCFLIDDDPDDQEIFSIAMEDVDPSHSCITASDCMEAIEKLGDDPKLLPDFIFLDLNMPFMTGQQCLPELKKMKHLKDVPIIIYSTSSNDADYRLTKKLGASHFMVKPSSISVLVDMLKLVLSRERLPFLLTKE